MKVSVIIPVYNGELYVAKAIESVLSQTCPPEEIIVIDDGSTDDTPRIMERFGSDITVKRVENRGVSNARNVGLAMARGEAIAFLDHDDVWFRRKLEKQIELMRKFPEAGMVCCNYLVRYERFKNRLVRHYSTLQNYRKLNFNRPLKAHPFKLLVEGNFIGTPSMVLIKKEVVDQVGLFNLTYQVGEDLDYFLRAALFTNFALLSETLSYKRTHHSNVTNDAVRFYESHREVLSQAIAENQTMVNAIDLADTCGLALAKNNYELGNVYYEQGFKKTAFRHYFQALAYSSSKVSVGLFLLTFFKKFARLLTSDRFTSRFKERLQQG